MPSVSYLQSRIKTLQHDLSVLNRKMADEKKKESTALLKKTRAASSINSRTSESMIRSKQREIDRANNDIVRAQNNQSDLMKDVVRKTEQLNKHNQYLSKEQEKEADKLAKAQQRKMQEQEKVQKDLMAQLYKQQMQLKMSPNKVENSITVEKEYDVFISHAAEDDEYVTELANKLTENEVTVWFDGFSLNWGDKIRRSIDLGLTHSRFGIIILSPPFLKKYWTNYELDGLLNLDQGKNKSFILPIWHHISKDDIIKTHPSIADIKALNTAFFTINEIVSEVKRLLK